MPAVRWHPCRHLQGAQSACDPPAGCGRSQRIGTPTVNELYRTARGSERVTGRYRSRLLSPAKAGSGFLGDVIPGLRSLRSLTRG